MKKTLDATLVLLFLLLSFNRADAAMTDSAFAKGKPPRGIDWKQMNKLEKIIYVETFKEGTLWGVVNCLPSLPKNSEGTNRIKNMAVILVEIDTDIYIQKINKWYEDSDERSYIPINNLMTLVFQEVKYKLNKQEIESILKNLAKQYNKK